MVHAVASGAVDDGVVGNVLAVVDHDGPEVDEDEQGDVGHLLQGKDEGEQVVGQALGVAVDRVESVAREGGGHDPLVVRLMQALVDQWVVQTAMDPVDAEVGEEDEERELEVVVPAAGALGGGVVQLGVALELEEDDGHGHGGHSGERLIGLLYLEEDLVLEESGVLHGGLIEDENVRECRENKVDQKTEEPVTMLVGTACAQNIRQIVIPDH